MAIFDGVQNVELRRYLEQHEQRRQDEATLVTVPLDVVAHFARCTVGWDRMGYGGNYTCLDRELDIAKPDHPTRDWWPGGGPCHGCELARALGREGKGTLTPVEAAAARREQEDRREWVRLQAKFGG